jgi:pimeloyl-ACP methyl ester carboxylesterase
VDEHQIVLLHGQPGSGADWQQLADRLPETLRVVALNRPGYGARRRAASGSTPARSWRSWMHGASSGQRWSVTPTAEASLAQLAPERVEALILLASVDPGCLTGWDRLAAPVTGEACARGVVADYVAGPGPAAIARLRRRPIAADEHVNWHIWGHAHHDHGPPWRSFLTEQRTLIHELGDLTASLAGVV